MAVSKVNRVVNLFNEARSFGPMQEGPLQQRSICSVPLQLKKAL